LAIAPGALFGLIPAQAIPVSGPQMPEPDFCRLFSTVRQAKVSTCAITRLTGRDKKARPEAAASFRKAGLRAAGDVAVRRRAG
jgi:hypothetical protein